MGVESLAQRPPRVTFTNVETGEDCTAQYNPEEIEETIKVNRKELDVLGLGYKPRQYQNTENWASSFLLGFDALSTYQGSPTRARTFLQSLCYPRKGAGNVAGAAPPRVQFAWPQLLTLTCEIDQLVFKHKRFCSTMASVLWTVEVKITEARVSNLFSEDVSAYGTFRS